MLSVFFFYQIKQSCTFNIFGKLHIFLLTGFIFSPYPFADGHCFFRHGLWVGHVVLHDGLEELVLVFTIKRWLEMYRSRSVRELRQKLQWRQFTARHVHHSEVTTTADEGDTAVKVSEGLQRTVTFLAYLENKREQEIMSLLILDG